jgi:hypothetical protein
VAAQQGCSFCAMVSRSTRRKRQVFESLPWDRVRRKMIAPGRVTIIEHMIGPLPRDYPLECADLDSADPKGLSPWNTDIYKY